eukprot:g3366.t1
MTLRCEPSSSSRRMRAKIKRAGAAVGKHEGQSAVRLMLPWWRRSVPKTIAESEGVGGLGPGRETGDGDAASHTRPKIANGVEAQAPEQQTTPPATPESTPICPAEQHDKRARGDNGSDTVNSQPNGYQIMVEKTEKEEQQEGIEYTHYSNLFENPPPSIPTVDQYILDDNISYGAITKRGQSRALPLNPSGGGILGIQECGDAPWATSHFASSHVDELETYVDPQDLLYADEDIDKLLSYFDHMGIVDNRVTLEEMISGFRRIRREWATVKAEESGRVVLAKVVRLMERAGMSLEQWFRFMDMSQNGRGDGKLTALEIRSGLERLVTYIARRECCCRAYKCNRIPNYGLPPNSDVTQAASNPKDGGDALRTDKPGSGHRGEIRVNQASAGIPIHTQDAGEASRSGPACISGGNANPAEPSIPADAGGVDVVVKTGRSEHDAAGRGSEHTPEADMNEFSACDAGAPQKNVQQQTQRERGAGADPAEGTCDPRGRGEEAQASVNIEQPSLGSTSAVADRAVARSAGENEDGTNDVDPEAFFEKNGKISGGEEGRSAEEHSKGLSLAGRAIACREHALEGMVYLGQRAYFLGLERQTFTSKEIGDLMRFIDTDVNFMLDLEETRLAVWRMRSDSDKEASARRTEAGHLLEVLEQYMHRTGARFTDVFSLLDKDRNGYIEKDELRTLFETLSREPARRRARAKAKAELAEEKLRQKELRAIEAHEAFIQLELFKKTGVYSVLKRIEVWQKRTGKRLSEGFHGGTGVGSGNRGLDVDELAAFMRNLDLDLSPSEAMLVLRHLDGGNDDLVEVKEVAAAVRTIRRYESVIKAAKRWGITPGSANAGGGRDDGGGGGLARPPSPTDVIIAKGVSLDDAADKRWSGDDDGTWGGGPGDLWEFSASSGLGGGRVLSAGAGRGCLGSVRVGVGGGSPASAASIERSATPQQQQQQQQQQRQQQPHPRRVQRGGGSPPPSRLAPQGSRGGGVSGGDSGFSAWGGIPPGVGTASSASSSGAAAGGDGAPAGREDSLPPWELGLRVRLDGSGGWWPEAKSAVEDGSRLNIYAGSVLDGRWLGSLDSRLRATMRGTRR